MKFIKPLTLLIVLLVSACAGFRRTEIIQDIEDRQDRILQYLNRGVYFYTEGQETKARRAFESMFALMNIKTHVEFEEITDKEEYRRQIVQEYIQRIEPELMDRSSSIQAQFKKGVTLFEGGNYRKAVDYFANILVLYPGHSEARRYVIRAANELEKIEQTRREEARAAREAELEKNIEEYYKTAVAFYETARLIDAYRTFKDVFEYDPDYRDAEEYMNEIGSELEDKSEMYYRDGLDAYSAGEIREAIRLWETALEHYPENSRAKRALERALARFDQ